MNIAWGDPNEAALRVGAELAQLLDSGTVLWLVSGGSNIGIQVQAMASLTDLQSASLTILPVDERYGPFGHAKSNSAAMRKAGFESKNANWIDILDDNPSIGEATALLAAHLSEAVVKEATIVATLGIGNDGHTAGVLPGSVGIHSPDLAVSYIADDFERLTLTLTALRDYIDYAFVSAFGEAKKPALKLLVATAGNTIDTTPALILNDINRTTLFTDQLDEKEYS